MLEDVSFLTSCPLAGQGGEAIEALLVNHGRDGSLGYSKQVPCYSNEGEAGICDLMSGFV